MTWNLFLSVWDLRWVSAQPSQCVELHFLAGLTHICTPSGEGTFRLLQLHCTAPLAFSNRRQQKHQVITQWDSNISPAHRHGTQRAAGSLRGALATSVRTFVLWQVFLHAVWTFSNTSSHSGRVEQRGWGEGVGAKGWGGLFPFVLNPLKNK